MRSVLCVFSALSALAAPVVAYAQTDSRLAASVRLAQEGQSDSARADIQRLLAETPPSDTLYPQILYSAAMIAPTTQEMQRYLQRVVVEHPSSEWVDESRLRLAQIDYGNGDLAGAARALERIRVDYPSSPLFPIAAQWAARTYFGLNDKTAACAWVSEGLARAGSDVEQRNRLEFYASRCEGVATVGPAEPRAASDTGAPGGLRAPAAGGNRGATPDSGAAVPAQGNGGAAVPAAVGPPVRGNRPTGETPVPPGAPVYRVQVAAAATQATADKVVASVRKLGLSSRVVRQNGLLKVRAGAYATRAEALKAAANLKAKLGGSPFIVADP